MAVNSRNSNCLNEGVCPLSKIRTGLLVRIKHLPSEPDLARRLREIGFVEEQTVKLITASSNFICQVCNTRFALSQQLAASILVTTRLGA